MSTYPVWDVTTARHLATFAHRGQRDKGGADYITHPQVVSTLVAQVASDRGLSPSQTLTATMAAWLHDVVEDTSVTAEMLTALGCPSEVVDVVVLLTRRAEVSSVVYYESIAADPVALTVKEADIRHNLDRRRLAVLDEPTRKRLVAKYAFACGLLGIDPTGLW